MRQGTVEKRSRPVWGLAAKLAVWLAASTAAFFILFGMYYYRHQRSSFETLILQTADQLSDLIQRSARYSMLRNDRDALYHLIRDIGQEPGVDRVRIINEQGRISFSTEQDEVGALVDLTSEGCVNCHGSGRPPPLDSPDARARIFRDASGNRVLGLIRTIPNEKDCWNAACHAHESSQQILGVIDNHLALAGVDAEVDKHGLHVVLATTLAILLFCVLSAVFVWRMVHRPVRELIVGTQRVAQGDLSYRLAVRSKDEMGVLAESFNRMTSDLAAARDELTEWAQTLEDRVQRKGEELERAHITLAGAEQMASLGKLAATVAHEVNSPLFGMLTYARLSLKKLSKGPLEGNAQAELAENLRLIERESKRCGDIIRNLLLFARQQRAEFSAPRMTIGDLNAAVERATKLVSHQYELQGIRLESRLQASMSPCRCDEGQLQQALLALLINAAEAMPGGGWVVVETREEPGAGYSLVVRDNGPGIAAEHLESIFQPFFTTKEEQHRTGLGLSIARTIIEQHGGSISVASQPGQGAEFTIRLPAVSGDIQQEAKS